MPFVSFVVNNFMNDTESRLGGQIKAAQNAVKARNSLTILKR